ncbi:MAG TPA: NlpC/P60 family protein [Methylomusa anaerophila]|uniref:Gamma-DL-glutamyl hydrolase n=1 Tax=Methylomusa anaerophila TaxID=1930071 RepID=A0A348AMN4_9FIRM|nr:NlpC/P60 family protein [Methylomusa anaerophila]BBB92332.1 gamma-DL-glutamyl hydrolase precursor [Methylomusa anaerophila]HML90028.1 NlpC/P60 family protein [Methylomusa anaerophila]
MIKNVRMFIVLMAFLGIVFLAYIPAYAAERVYSIGDEGLVVAQIQLKLNQFGYSKRVINGKFDKDMSKAIKEFQKKNNLQQTGVVDKVTYKILFDTDMPEIKAPQQQKAIPAKSTGVTKTASKYLGTPYRFGGAGPGGFDCSGFVMYVFDKNGKKLPRTADVQFTVGRKIDRVGLTPGDLVFFTTYAPGASHVGIYYGDGKFIHASSSRGVMISKLDESYWKARYLGAKRVL